MPQMGSSWWGFLSCVLLRCTMVSHPGRELMAAPSLSSLHCRSSVSALQVCLRWWSVPAPAKLKFFYRMHPREGKVYSHLWCAQEFCFQMLLRSTERTLYLQECWQEGEERGTKALRLWLWSCCCSCWLLLGGTTRKRICAFTICERPTVELLGALVVRAAGKYFRRKEEKNEFALL